MSYLTVIRDTAFQSNSGAFANLKAIVAYTVEAAWRVTEKRLVAVATCRNEVRQALMASASMGESTADRWIKRAFDTFGTLARVHPANSRINEFFACNDQDAKDACINSLFAEMGIQCCDDAVLFVNGKGATLTQAQRDLLRTPTNADTREALRDQAIAAEAAKKEARAAEKAAKKEAADSKKIADAATLVAAKAEAATIAAQVTLVEIATDASATIAALEGDRDNLQKVVTDLADHAALLEASKAEMAQEVENLQDVHYYVSNLDMDGCNLLMRALNRRMAMLADVPEMAVAA